MATPPFKYQPMFEKGKDTTEYYLLTKDYVSVSEFEGNPILKIEKEGLTVMANAAFRDVSFMRLFRWVYIKHILKRTCVTHRMRL